MEEITAAGGVLFRKRENVSGAEVLLIYRRDVWDLPKGKLEKGESIKECARREVAEEVGCMLPEIHTKLVNTYHEYREGKSLIGKNTHWFAMSLLDDNENLEPEEREGIEKLEWIPQAEAREKVGYENLVDVLKDFQRWYALKK